MSITSTKFYVFIRPEFKNQFIQWQAKLNGAINGVPGFISLEFQATDSKWIISERFSDPDLLKKWQNSQTYIELTQELKALAIEGGFEEKSEQAIGGVTEVIIAKIDPTQADIYRKWSAKIHKIEANFPGFQGVYIQSSTDSHGSHWVTLLQFDTQEHLDGWLNSQERKDLIKESNPMISSLETHRVKSPFAGWFSNGPGAPAVWKQTMMVLLVLFPIVVLEMKYLNPRLAGLNSSVAIFIGNALSVALIAFPMMPIAIWLFKWWLSSREFLILGILAVISCYLLEIILFWNFL